MDIKLYNTLETLKNDFNFAFHMPQGATWGNAIDAAFEILEKLHSLSQQSIQSAKPVQPVAPVENADAAPVEDAQG